MYDNPLSLQDLCLECICENYDEVFEWVDGEEDYEPMSGEYIEIQPPSYRFKDPDIYLFNELSEKLMRKMNEKNKLSNILITIFSGRNTKLSNVQLKDSSVTPSGLKILKQHKIIRLQYVNTRQSFHISRIIRCLNDYSIEHLQHLDVSHCSFLDIARCNMMVQITRLLNLRSLNVSNTEITQNGLQLICEDLKHLESLDITRTWIFCAKPLLLIKNTLTKLIASDLNDINEMIQVIIELDNLRYLDISLVETKFENFQSIAILTLLDNPDKLPKLAHLDISGWKDLISKGSLETFITSHKQLAYLGVVLNPVAFEIFLSEPSPDWDLVIAGLGSEDQIINALKRYYDRHTYVQKLLYHLFQLTGAFSSSRSDIFKLVLPAMQAHRSKFGVQMAATACLYNLTRGEFSKKIHPRLLGKAVNMTLKAMVSYPTEYQLQKNALLTLCNDRILQDVDFNKFECAGLVLKALCAFNEPNMNRMSVAICSILAAKISTTETAKLGSNPTYMRKLLDIVKIRVDSANSDITLKFTLSALWNLTDECELTCLVFLQNNGVDLFLKVLKQFRNDSAVETKVLGLLNNIAEVMSLRMRLMSQSLMEELLYLLQYQHIDVSYFAAGIVAHLASDGEEKWLTKEIDREIMLEHLEKAVTGWDIPDTEMVAYRSFKPFYSLLKVGIDYRVQLWALWAIHHVCTKNAKRYCLMLKEEQGYYLIKLLQESDVSHVMVKYACIEIMQLL